MLSPFVGPIFGSFQLLLGVTVWFVATPNPRTKASWTLVFISRLCSHLHQFVGRRVGFKTCRLHRKEKEKKNEPLVSHFKTSSAKKIRLASVLTLRLLRLFLLQLSPLGAELLVLSALLVVGILHLLKQLALLLAQHSLGALQVLRLLACLLFKDLALF